MRKIKGERACGNGIIPFLYFPSSFQDEGDLLIDGTFLILSDVQIRKCYG